MTHSKDPLFDPHQSTPTTRIQCLGIGLSGGLGHVPVLAKRRVPMKIKFRRVAMDMSNVKAGDAPRKPSAPPEVGSTLSAHRIGVSAHRIGVTTDGLAMDRQITGRLDAHLPRGGLRCWG